MSYQKDRDEFVAVIGGEVSNAGDAVALAKLVLRNASIIQSIAVKDCNSPLTDGDRKEDEMAEARITEACKPWGITPTFNGDPRGCCVKLLLPSGRWNSWGGAEDGFCVPVR